MENVLKLKFDYENTGFSRTHYLGEFKNKKYNIVIIHNKEFNEICTASSSGEPESPIKKDIKILLNNKLYITQKLNEYTTILKEV